MRATHGEAEFALRVDARRVVADRICLLDLRNAAGTPLPVWQPGAHIDLHLGSGRVRQYSLCGTPADRSTWQVAILLDEQSRGGSAYAHSELHVGSTVTARGPRNLFPLEPAEAYLFIAGGIGITPLVPMIEDVAARGAEWRLVYGGRNRASMAFAEELTAKYGDKVQVVPQDEQGLLPVSEVVAASEPHTAVYCCGPESLIAAVEEAHARRGRGTLHVERFSPRDQGAPEDVGAFEVEAVRSGKVVTVHAGVSILDALGAAGVNVLNSCSEGICGTCEVFVIDGRPDHRDSILTDEERETSETMFVCVSRSRSPRLVLDV